MSSKEKLTQDPQVVIPEPLVVTASAAKKVGELIAEEGDMALKLRVYIEGGGCSGFQYGFTFDGQVQVDDTVVTKTIQCAESTYTGPAEIAVIVDPMSYQYLVGAEIDFCDDLEGARFIIRNPNATTTCGCGSSFDVAD